MYNKLIFERLHPDRHQKIFQPDRNSISFKIKLADVKIFSHIISITLTHINGSSYSFFSISNERILHCLLL